MEISEKTQDFWAYMGNYFKVTENFFRHANEGDAEVVVRQLDKVVLGREDTLCMIGFEYLPHLAHFGAEWQKVGQYLQAVKGERVCCRDQLAELKLVASGVRDGRLSESAKLLPLY